jgi:hypothetical protein
VIRQETASVAPFETSKRGTQAMNGTINVGRSEIEELTAEEIELVTGGLSIIDYLLLIWEGIRMKPVYSSYDPSLDHGGE